MYKPQIIITSAVVTASLCYCWWLYRKIQKNKIPSKWVPVGKVSEVLIYPMKSGYRMVVEEAECTNQGLVQVNSNGLYKLRDRFLVTYKDSDNEFRTGRTHPKLILITISNHDADHVAFDAPGMRTLYVKMPIITDNTEKKILKFRSESIEMVDCGDEAASWLSRYCLEQESGLRLGFHDGSLESRTLIRKNYMFYPNLNDNDMGIFSDLTCAHLINQSSISDLNTRLEIPATPYQFRPNIIVENAVAYAEDNWTWLRIGQEAVFYNVKPCTRCVFTTIDSETAERSKNRQPLKTLEGYRQIPDPEERKAACNTPTMGLNLGLRKPGIIKPGDILYVGVR